MTYLPTLVSLTTYFIILTVSASIPFTFHYPTLGVKMVVKIKPRNKIIMAKKHILHSIGRVSFLAESQTGSPSQQKVKCFKKNKTINWKMEFQMFYMYILVHHALSKHIEFKENRWSYVFSKGKGVYFKRRNPFITTRSLNIGACKEIKTCYVQMN